MPYRRSGALYSAMASIVFCSTVVMNAPASATDGYFQNGYGMKSIGMGGVSYALSSGGMNGANNPASASFAESQVDLGVYLFSPDRGAQRSGNAYGLNGSVTSGDSLFAIPEIGLLYHLNDTWSTGLTVYGNGGMNTTYPGGQIPANTCGLGAPASNLLCGQGKLGVNLNQVIIAPTLSYKAASNFSVAVAPQLLAQQFSASGLQAFSGYSAAPADLTNRGASYSYGAGLKFGAFWVASPLVTLGLTYQTEISASKFSNYSGLFAAPLHVPANLGFGVSLHPGSSLTLAADFERIFYGDVRSIANQSSSASPLGTINGPGFGWSSINIFKVGVSYVLSPSWTVRAGYNYSDNPISTRNVTFNILTPAVVQHHASVGATYQLDAKTQLTVAYNHAFQQTMSGATSPLLPGGGTDRIRLSEDEVGLAIAYHF